MGSDACVSVFLWSPGPCPHAAGAAGLEVYGGALERVNALACVCVRVSTNTHCVFACLRLPVHMEARGVHSVGTPLCVRAQVWPQAALRQEESGLRLSTPVPVHLDMSARGKCC